MLLLNYWETNSLWDVILGKEILMVLYQKLRLLIIYYIIALSTVKIMMVEFAYSFNTDRLVMGATIGGYATDPA